MFSDRAVSLVGRGQRLMKDLSSRLRKLKPQGRSGNKENKDWREYAIGNEPL